MSGLLRRARHAHDTARWTGEHGVLALEAVGIGQATRGLHEQQAHARHVGSDLLHIAAQDGREIGIDHGGVAPADELHQRAGGMRGAHLREARGTRQPRRRLLVLGKAVAVHEDDGHAAQARVVGGPQTFFQVLFIERLHHLTACAQALLRLDHPCVQQFGQHDVAIEQPGAVLVGDAQRVAKAPRGDQQRGLALALQQGVGGHGGAHLHALHQRGGDGRIGRQAQQVAHARHGRVAVVTGVFGQQLVRDQAAIGPPPHDVGEGAAPVDPELPAGCEGLSFHGHRLLCFL